MSNGRLDTRDLAVIPGGTKMGGSALIRADLLPGLVGLQAAFLARFDTPLRPTSAADGYRSYDSQVRAFLGRYAPQATGVGPFSDVRWWQGRRYVRVSGASAAVPGTSNHGWAVAVDFADVGPTGGQRWEWLMDAAPRFGFVNPLWARDGRPENGSQEPWHWEGRAVPVSNYRAFLAGMGLEVPGVTAPDPITPVPPAPADPFGEDPTMYERAIIAAYRKHLGRTPGAAEVDDRILRIAADDKPADRLRVELSHIAGSDEAKRYPVVRLYQRLLGRSASAAEADRWLTSSGGDLAKVEAGIKASEEYRRRQAATKA